MGQLDIAITKKDVGGDTKFAIVVACSKSTSNKWDIIRTIMPKSID